jgi:hypothetical protein
LLCAFSRRTATSIESDEPENRRDREYEAHEENFRHGESTAQAVERDNAEHDEQNQERSAVRTLGGTDILIQFCQ